jgi:hypothetical protein
MARMAVVMSAMTFLAATAHGALAQAPAAPVALVVEVSGATTPALAAYREIRAGTTVTLAPASRLVVLHYDSCRTVTVVGGHVSFGAEAVPVIKGASAHSDERAPCPRRFAPSGTTAATVFRSVAPGPGPATPALTLSLTPGFVLVGPRAGDFEGVRILRGGEEIVAGRLDGPRFLWPVEVPPLAAGDYQLSLFPAERLKPPVVLRFTTSPTPAVGAGLTLIDLD